MNRKALSSSIRSLELTFIHSMTTFCVKILTLFDCSNTDPYDRSVRNVASAGSLAEHSDPYGIDEAFSKVHTGVFFEAVEYPETRRSSVSAKVVFRWHASNEWDVLHSSNT